MTLGTVTELIPRNTPGSLTCIFQQTASQATSYGAGLLSACSYASGVYTINAPIGGLDIGKEYTVSVLEFNQLTTSFTMPTQPINH